jgi:hypothetical protein
MEYLHYIHGVNPLGLVYLTNMKSAGASHSASTMFHNWFAHGTRWKGPAAPRRVDRRDILWEVQIHAIPRINVATPPLEPRDIDAFSRPPFYYAARVTRQRSGS